MMTFLNVFRSVGGAFDDRRRAVDGGIRFWHPGGELRAVALETDVHPGFMTDWQQPMVVALTQARGLSIVHETVYERRLGYTEALNQMGATIQTYRDCLGGTPCRFGRRNFMHSAVIAGPSKLHAADLVIPDLRAGFSHLIAALAAEGTSRVYGVDLINRGYEDFEAKLAALGAARRTRRLTTRLPFIACRRCFAASRPTSTSFPSRPTSTSASAEVARPRATRPASASRACRRPSGRWPGGAPAAPRPASRWTRTRPRRASASCGRRPPRSSAARAARATRARSGRSSATSSTPAAPSAPASSAAR